MALSGDFNQILYAEASRWVQRGWSVIPLKGDLCPENPKSPALLTWREFQHRLPTERELQRWFLIDQYPALGIVLGQVSKLVVVDVDEAESGAALARCLPDLLDTFTVRSGNRSLPHYYFQLTDGIAPVSRYGLGIEFRSDGHYVVAPGTRINGKVWEIVNPAPPRPVNKLELRDIVEFVALTASKIGRRDGKLVSGWTADELVRLYQKPIAHSYNSTLGRGEAMLRPPEQGDAVPNGNPAAKVVKSSVDHVALPPVLTVAGLRRQYTRLAWQYGRNNALFAVTLYARDRGWTRNMVLEALVTSHVNQPPVGNLRPETPTQREREAKCTVASAFTRPARPIKSSNDTTHRLPNAVREALLQCGLDQVARVLDALLLAGFKAGQQFTSAQAYQAIRRFGVGKNTVLAALKALLNSGKAVFEKLFPPPPAPPPFANAALRCAVQTKQCLFGRVAKPVKKRGRPATVFVMPSIEALCQLLGARARGSDPICPDDLQSPAAYRAALHVGLIRRAPGQYPRVWQAQRLGVSKDSCRRYERKAGVIAAPSYESWPVHWGNVESMVSDESPGMGYFLEDERGKRYPPLLVIARQLLARKRRLVFRSQEANYYALPEATNARPAGSMVGQSERAASAPMPVLPVTLPELDTDQEAAKAVPVAKKKVSSKTAPRQSTSAERILLQSDADVTEPGVNQDAQKTCAERIYRTLRQLNPQKSLTRQCAQNLVTEYGEKLIERGLRVTTTRRNIHNPAGFLQVWLRSEKKFG